MFFGFLLFSMKQWDELASDTTIEKTVASLKANNIDVIVVATGEEAKKKALELIPVGSQVYTISSMTIDTIGLTQELNESGNYDAVRKKLYAMDRNTQAREIRTLGAAPDWTVGSVHAVTQDGRVLVASNSGSQLPGYASSSGHVIWVVGAQKIVKNIDEGMMRMYEYCLPLEDARMQKAYGMGSAVNKILIINKEKFPGRTQSLCLPGNQQGKLS